MSPAELALIQSRGFILADPPQASIDLVKFYLLSFCC